MADASDRRKNICKNKTENIADYQSSEDIRNKIDPAECAFCTNLAVQAECKDKTVLLVSHRKSTMAVADLSFSVESGRLS